MFQFAVTGVYSSNKSASLIFSEDMANLIPFIILVSHITKQAHAHKHKKPKPFYSKLLAWVSFKNTCQL